MDGGQPGAHRRAQPGAQRHRSLRAARTLLAEADACDARLARGELSGWMHGFPIAVKDLQRRAGPAHHAWARDRAAASPARCAVRAAHEEAPAPIVIGKTNTPEFGLGSHTLQPVFGTTRNAWTRRCPPAQQRRRGRGAGAGHGAGGRRQRHWRVAAQSRGLQQRRGLAALAGPSVAGGAGGRRVLPRSWQPMARWGRTPRTSRGLLCTMAGWDHARRVALAERLPRAGRGGTRSPRRPGLRIGWLGSIWPDLPLEAGIR
jgi:amidase